MGNRATRDEAILKQLAAEDAIGQLRRRDGLMATLGTENGELKLDWVEGVQRLLDHPTQLEEMESEARAIWQSGIRHIIWAGMGGSVITVRVLAELGFCDGNNGERIAIYPLDSTDPAALNAIVDRLARAKGLRISSQAAADPAFLQALLHDVMMIGVSMGMTSEEPITHLTWFAGLLTLAQLPAAAHILVMTLPGSYLDQFARERQTPSRPLQLDRGTGTGGRMSAPTTRVFLLPAALYLTRLTDQPGLLRTTLSKAWRDYNLDSATEHPFVRLAAACYQTDEDGACHLLVDLPEQWKPLVTWIEQLMEESLGKGGKGIVIFKESTSHSQATIFRGSGTLHVRAITEESDQPCRQIFELSQPYLDAQEPHERLATVITCFLGWQLCMAVYGYLHQITFAGQPAVENYKERARSLRTLADPLEVLQNWEATLTDRHLTLFAPAPGAPGEDPAKHYARAIRRASVADDTEYLPYYLDLTINGVIPDSLKELITTYIYRIGNQLFMPVKLRTAPADYHSTEQSEMDGPPYLISLRLLMREHEQSHLGTYSDAFLRAQAVSTWQAMIEQGRTCFLMLVDGQAEQAGETLQQFFTAVEQIITPGN